MRITGSHPDSGAARPQPPLAVVTGGSGGIGQRILSGLNRLGYDTVTLSRSAPVQSAESPVLFRHIPCDLSDPASVEQAAAGLCAEKRPVDLLIHCAGIISPGPVESASSESIVRQITINLTAPVLLTARLLPLIPAGGHIIFINSLAAVMPLADSAVYVAGKAALRSFALSLSLELKARNVAVSSIFPGAVDTAMLREEMAHGGSVLNFVSAPATPEAIADTVMKAVRHPGKERFTPVLDGYFGRLCMMFPGLLRLALPVLTWFGNRGSERARRRAG